MAYATEHELVRQTIADISLGIAKLLEERDQIDERVQQMTARKSQWEALLKQNCPAPDPGKPRGIRRKKGENRCTVLDFFRAKGDLFAFTIKEISDATGLPFGSVRTVLEKEKSPTFLKDEDGRWRLKGQTNDAQS